MVTAAPEGLLLHVYLLYFTVPPHFGMRQYWRDFDSLEGWAHDLPHKAWWRDYLRDRAGPASGTDVFPRRSGGVRLCRHATFGFHQVCAESAGSRLVVSARRRLGLKEEGTAPAPVVTEEALYKP